MDRITEPTVFAGSGAELYRSLLERLGASARFTPAPIACSALAVAQLGVERLGRGEGQSAADLVPVYLRRPIADEAQRRARAQMTQVRQ